MNTTTCRLEIITIREDISSVLTSRIMNSINFTDTIETTKKVEVKKVGGVDDSGTKEILCDGYFYDVGNFISRHPGGSIIKYYTKSGEDASHAIQQFHQRSIKQVRMMMKAFKRRPASDSERMY